MKKQTIIILIGFLLLGVNAYAQVPSGKISGRVIDERHQPNAYVTVSILRATDSVQIKSTLTAENGTFSFDIPAGSFLVKVSVVGYDKMIAGPFNVSANNPTIIPGDIILATATKQLSGGHHYL